MRLCPYPHPQSDNSALKSIGSHVLEEGAARVAPGALAVLAGKASDDSAPLCQLGVFGVPQALGVSASQDALEV
jgi:hypothetical protein